MNKPISIHNTSSKSKRGSMLVLVLIIMVVGLVFIASALMITNVARTRYYEDAESSQARLTVASVAESFYQAVYIQEITDDQLEALANGGATLTFDSTSIPGLGGSADNTTTAVFSKLSSDMIQIEFSTTIDGKTENVRMVLSASVTNPQPALFQNTVELGEGANLGQCIIGYNAPSTVTDNYVVLHGDSYLADSGTGEMYSTVVCTGIITGGSGNTYYNDIVLWGEDAGYNVNSNGNGITIAPGFGSIYFVSPDGALGNTFYDGSGNAITSSVGSYFNLNVDNVVLRNFNYNGYGQNMYNIINGSVLADNGSLNNTVLQYGDANPSYGTATENWGPTSPYNLFVTERDAAQSAYSSNDALMTALADRADAYLNGSYTATIQSGFPTSDEARSMFGVSATAPAGAQVLSVDTSSTITTGDYVIRDSTMGAYSWVDESSRPVITCDLSAGDITIYVNTPTFVINNGYFNVINGQAGDHWLRFILIDNCQMDIGTGANMYTTTTGIISTGTHTGATCADSGKPSVYIFGASGNTVRMEQHAVVDAYIGLFGESSSGNAGTVIFANEPYFYGRVTATTLSYANGTPAHVPYCPSPDANVSNSDYSIVYSEYSIEEFEYYY